ncbi:MAG TPA: site-specific integrase, partial [Candidatus Acidoferrum sp.]|nr:site-specific integrase [Candidatus Acidoferrum sp.]
MKKSILKFLEYLQSVKNSSPHTISNYGKDLHQFLAYLTPPESEPPELKAIHHTVIREFVGHLHDQSLEKSSIARKLAALRSFFKYCVREGMLKENPARLVPTPKLPKRIPSVLSAEEMNGFLNQLAGMKSDSEKRAALPPRPAESERKAPRGNADEEGLLIRRDRAILELLYAAGLRVSELTGLNIVDMDCKDRILRVRGKGNKERIVPYGSKAEEALDLYWPVRERILEQNSSARTKRGAAPHTEAIFLNYAGRRLTQRSVGR